MQYLVLSEKRLLKSAASGCFKKKYLKVKVYIHEQFKLQSIERQTDLIVD